MSMLKKICAAYVFKYENKWGRVLLMAALSNSLVYSNPNVLLPKCHEMYV